jgi:hypothetical protein
MEGEMRSHWQMTEGGDWPPTNKEAILFVIGAIFGFIVGVAGTLLLLGNIK